MEKVFCAIHTHTYSTVQALHHSIPADVYVYEDKKKYNHRNENKYKVYIQFVDIFHG